MNTQINAFLGAPIAHRGYHDITQGRPENSLAAISAAIRAGYGIEIDIQASADHQAMVFHDYDLGRLTCENGPVRQRLAEDLSQITLNGCDEGIPTLAKVLDLVAGQVPLVIEIKDQDGAMGSNVGKLENAVAQDLRSYKGPVVVMSFNPHSVALFKDLLPEIPRGLITGAYSEEHSQILPATVRDRLREIRDYERVGASFVSHQSTDLNRPRIMELKNSGAAILCWTVKSELAEHEARKIADNITFENYPASIPET